MRNLTLLTYTWWYLTEICLHSLKAFIISLFRILYSFVIALWCGCFKAETLKSESLKYMKELLRLVYDDNPYLSFHELLMKDKLVGIHQRNLQFLATEIFRVKNGVFTGLTENTFQFVNKTYEIIVYCLEEEIGQFFTEQEVFPFCV